MTRELIHDATVPIRPGDEVKTPTGRRAFVESIDRRLGEVTVRFPAELAAFRPRWLRRADTTEGGGLVILPSLREPEAPEGER